MAEESQSYIGVPLGAVFEASQKSLRTLNFKIKDEKISNGRIVAKSKMSWNSFGQDIVLEMDEVGQSTELKITTSSGQLTDWGEGKKIVKDILDEIDVEINKIREAGRIKSDDVPKFDFGDSAPTQLAVKQRPATKNSSNNNRSGGNWVLRVLVAGGLFWVFFTSSGAEFASSLLRSLSVETDISRYDCDQAAELVTGESLQNIFGGQFRIVAVSNLSQVSKTDRRIVCTGDIDLSNATSQRMRITVESGSSSAQVLYRVEPL